MKTKIFLPLICLLLLHRAEANAQGEGNFWFFGYGAGIDFNSGSPIAITVGALSTDEGCASISDAAGNLLFYTDGVTVWNKLHSPMWTGTGLLGDPSSTQSAIIVPKPGTTDHYYIFTTPDLGSPDVGLRYSEVDMSLFSGLGDVLVGVKNIMLLDSASEKVTAVKNADGVDLWVVAHTPTTDEYYAYSITSAGVSTTPVISATGTVAGSQVGYLKAAPNGRKLASAMDLINNVDILDFDNSTGVVSFDFSFSRTAAYGVEFSPSSERLYVTSEIPFDGSITSLDIDQYDMTLGSPAAIIASRTTIGTSGSAVVGTLQNGPDKKMYFARLGTNYLGCIPYPDSLGMACGFIDTAVNLSGRTCYWGLPNFITSFFRTSLFDFVHVCIGDSTFFTLTDTSATVDSIRWDFGDPVSGINNIASGDSVYHVFTAVGNYTVTLISGTGSVFDTVTSVVAILGVPSIRLGNDTSICGHDSITLDAGAGGYSYLWQDGSTNQTFRVATSGTYYVAKMGICATGYDTIQVSVIPLSTVIVGSDTICSGSDVTLVASGANTYLWSTGDTMDSVTVMPAITTTYTVTGTSLGCADSATATVTVNSFPIISTSGDVSIIAGLSTTTLSASGGATYNWSPSAGLSCTTCATPIADPAITTIYCVEVSNGSCIDTACLTLTVETPCPDGTELSVPDAFSPNNDGNNDNFLLQGWYGCVKEFSIVIYDRWGEKVFESNDVNFNWDGTYNGKTLDPAVFVYYAKGILSDHTRVERKGNITLIR